MAAKTDTSSKPKQGVFVYSKLQSFEKASLAVQQLLQDVCKSMDNIEVKPYDEDYNLKDYLGVTVVVVIDSQQTRTVITPQRKDGNVDHWDDLKRLSSKRTSPAGSILIVIYGDESSKDGNDLLSPKWLQVWQYNDPRSYRSAGKNTIYSILHKFNENQKESIQHHLKMVSLCPTITGKEMNILFLSQQTEKDKTNQFLDDNPFVFQQTVEKCGECKAITFSSYTHFQDLFSEQTSPACLKVHYRDYPIINLRAEKSFKNVLKKILAPMKPDSQGCKSRECRSFPPVFDRLIYCCNAREPFQISNQTEFRQEIEQLKNELEHSNLRLRGEALSIMNDKPNKESSDSANDSAPSMTTEETKENDDSTNDSAPSMTTEETKENDDSTNDSRCSVILFLKRQSKEPLADQRVKILRGIDGDSLCRSHVYHLMQSPTLLEPNLSLDKDERETMNEEIKTVEKHIKSLESQLRLKKERASALKNKLSGKGEGSDIWSWIKNPFSKKSNVE